MAESRRGGGGRQGPLAHDLFPRRLHALPLRQERDDIPLYPPQQRPHRAVRGQRRLQARRRLRRPGRREGHGGRADRLERRLGRRRGQPPPPLRGAPGRRRRRQPLAVPQRGRAAAVPRSDRRVVLARRPRRSGRSGRGDDHHPCERRALVARRSLDIPRARAGRRARRRKRRRGRPDARRRAREPRAALAAVTQRDAHDLHRLHEPREGDGGRPTRAVARRGADHASGRLDGEGEAGAETATGRSASRRRAPRTTTAGPAPTPIRAAPTRPGRARCAGNRRWRSLVRPA